MPFRVVQFLGVSRSSVLVRAGMGALIATTGVLFRLALDPLVSDQVPFAIALAATVLATWIGGVAGGTANVLISAVLVDFAVVPPRFQFSPIEHAAAEAVFLIVGFTLVWQVGRLRKAEIALRESEANAREREAEIASIYDSAPIGLCIVDRDGRYLRINRRLAEIHGLPPELHIGRTFSEVMPGISEAASGLLRQVMETGEPARDVEIQGELPSSPGVVQTWSENWFPVRDESGRVVGVNVAVQEITERKRVEQELREANQAKDEFLATLSHELRTPLSAILGWAQILARGGIDERLAKQAIETISRNAQAQTRLVTDVLDVSRMMSGKLRLDIQDVDLLPLLRDAVDSIRPAANAKRLTLKIVSEAEPVMIRADASRIQQVFWNLLSNAAKFTDPGGRVTAELQRHDSDVLLIVRDTGIGIKPEFLPRVFDRFSQADASPSRQHSGLGLGLSIVRHLVELHGGTVSAHSEGQGRGSEFTVSLPALAIRRHSTQHGSASAATAVDPALVAGHARGAHVLVLDDMADARTLVAAVLEPEGMRVSAAASADEALDRIAATRPDIVLADIGIPDVDGYEFLRRLRALPAEHGGRTPVIAVTAYGGEADRDKMLAAGFLAHVPKPIDRERLLASLSLARSGARA
ncbi:MAG: ATP-binding protein [Acidobacteriota bacterium]